MKASPILLNKLDYYFSDYFKDRKYFVCIYGSYANGHANKNSDIDMFIASRKPYKDDLRNIKNFVLNFHKQNHLSMDIEVPYDTKLLTSYRDIRDAINLKGFVTTKRGGIVIPKIEKTKKFLESHEVKLRLILNALSSPHIFLGNDREKYLIYKKHSENAVYNLALRLNALEQKDVTAENLVNVLLNSSNNENGELYLGYKNYNTVKNYLINFIKINIR